MQGTVPGNHKGEMTVHQLGTLNKLQMDQLCQSEPRVDKC